MPALFVYGTLRPGCHSYRLLEQVTVREEIAYADGLALYEGPGFPYASPLADARVTGVLCTIPAADWSTTLTFLDALEGYDPARETTSHYLRRRRQVSTVAGLTDSGTRTEAWIYLAGPRIDLSGYRRIRGGDWLNRPDSARPRPVDARPRIA